MKRRVLLRFLFAIAFVIVLGGVAQAVTITFTDLINFSKGGIDNGRLEGFGGGDVNFLENKGDFVNWTHVFIAPISNILSATISVSLIDDDPDTMLGFEWGKGTGDSGSVTGEVDTRVYTFNISPFSVLDDGEYGIYLESLYGDFSIEWSELTIVYDSVPEPSTVLLLGVGFVGIAVYNVKRKRRAVEKR